MSEADSEAMVRRGVEAWNAARLEYFLEGEPARRGAGIGGD